MKALISMLGFLILTIALVACYEPLQIYPSGSRGPNSPAFPNPALTDQAGSDTLTLSPPVDFSVSPTPLPTEIPVVETPSELIAGRGPFDQVVYQTWQENAGWLGLPVTDQYSNALGLPTANFEGGFITTGNGLLWEAREYEKGRIAFAKGLPGARDIHVMGASGLNETRLTTDPADDYAPAWSPEGNRIAFVSNRTGQPQVHIIATASRRVVRVPGTGGATSVTWMPDGRRIVFRVPRSILVSPGEKGEQVFLTNVDGGPKVMVLENTDFPGYGVGVSPDGNLLAYTGGDVSTTTLFITNLRGLTKHQFEIPSGGGSYPNPSWSPDGKYVALSGPLAGGVAPGLFPPRGAIQVVDLRSGKTRTLSLLPGRHPSWSADSQAIIFEAADNTLHLVHLDGAIARKVSIDDAVHSDPDWFSNSMQPIATGTSTTAELPSRPQKVTKDELIHALEGLSQVSTQKIDSDIELTAATFTAARGHQDDRRGSERFLAPIKKVGETLELFESSNDQTLTPRTALALKEAEATSQVTSAVLMLNSFWEAGGRHRYGLDGPNFVSSFEEMLKDSDRVSPPSAFDSASYHTTIKNHLYGAFPDQPGPLVIPRKSGSVDRRNVEFLRGAYQVRTEIDRSYSQLITELETGRLPVPPDISMDELIAQLEALEVDISKSMRSGTEIKYNVFLQQGKEYVPVVVETNLGAVSDQHRLFGLVASRMDQGLDISQEVRVISKNTTGEDGGLIYVSTYSLPGGESIEIVQKGWVSGKVVIGPYGRYFSQSGEEMSYSVPPEMVLSLPIELSNLLMISQDIEQSIRRLLTP